MLASFPGWELAWEWGYSSPICSVNCTLSVNCKKVYSFSVFLLTKVRLFTLRILCSFKQLPLVVESEEDLNEVRQDAVYQSWNFSRPELSDSLLVWAVLNFTAFCFTCSEDGTVAETSILKLLTGKSTLHWALRVNCGNHYIQNCFSFSFNTGILQKKG